MASNRASRGTRSDMYGTLFGRPGWLKSRAKRARLSLRASVVLHTLEERMDAPADHDVTQLLAAFTAGNERALDQLLPLVYAQRSLNPFPL
jgi:hypothetical protein